MRSLFEQIREEIRTSLKDDFKTVEEWNDQIDKSLVERTEEGFPYPAVFIDLIAEETHNRALGVKDVVVRIDFHFAIESYLRATPSALKTYDLLDKFDQVIHRFRGTDFSTLQEITVEWDDDKNTVDKPIRSYRTVWRNPGSYREQVEFEGTITPQVNGQIAD